MPRSYYDILGVPRTASLDEIKKRYRELARQYHPDVNRDKPAAGKMFSEITTAYKALSNPEERAAYDADMALRESRARMAASRAANATPPSASASGPRPQRHAPSSSAPRSAPGGTPPRGPGPPPNADTARLLAEAQAAFVRGKFVEARALCEQVLRRDRRSALAYEVLGDVYRMQNRADDAINMYTMSLQFNPRNTTVMQRLERMSRASTPAQKVFFDNRYPGTGAASGGPAGSRSEAATPDKRPLGLLIAGVLGYGLTFLLLLYVALIDKGRPLRDAPTFLAPISSWSWTLITVMGLAGLVLGFTMAATMAIRRMDDELVLPGARSSGGFLPLGLILIVVSILSFYAAALLYAIIGFLQESLTPSMLRVFGAVVIVVLLLTVIYTPGPTQVFLFGGNVVFLAFLIGWVLGDFFRPDNF